MNASLILRGVILKFSLKPKNAAVALIGSAILAFGLYNIHSLSGVTEGGILGLTLFFQHWLNISPAWSGLVMNAACYLIGWRVLGLDFVLYSIISGGGFSLFYGIFEQFPPLWPSLALRPLLAALLGAIFVGVGVGLCVRVNGAPSGDDALALSICKKTGWNIQWAYLISDLTVLALSATYIAPLRLLYSLMTVVLSGQIIGWIQRFTPHKRP